MGTLPPTPWYDVITWVPAPDEYFWMAPGRFNKDGKSAINGIYLDKIKFTVVDADNDSLK